MGTKTASHPPVGNQHETDPFGEGAAALTERLRSEDRARESEEKLRFTSGYTENVIVHHGVPNRPS